MEVTWIGVLVAIAAMLLMRRSASAMLSLLMLCTLFGGSAAILLGDAGVTVVPASFVLLFVVIRLTIAVFVGPVGVIAAIERNIFLALFVLYGVVGAYVFPRMFEGQIELAPMRLAYWLGSLQGEPLHPTPQNNTQSIYLVGTLLAAICSTIIVRREQKLDLLVKTLLWCAWIHIGFGILDVVLYGAGAGKALDVFRNATYEMTSAEIGSFKRISGVFPEASSYATYGFALCTIASELWLRSVRPKVTGPTALCLGLMVLASTSSTGIVVMAVYAPLVAIRIFTVQPAALAMRKMTSFGAVAMFGIAGAMIVMLLNRELADSVSGVFDAMVFGKAQSESGIQRAFWAKQGIDAFLFSGGLGVGPGSFRSSSLLTAILGSVGVFGAVCFVLHLWRLWKPLGATQGRTDTTSLAIARSFGWGAALSLLAPVLSSSTPDPGLLFGILGGAAMGVMVGQPAAAGVAPVRTRASGAAAEPRRAFKLSFRAPKRFAELPAPPTRRVPEQPAAVRKPAAVRRSPPQRLGRPRT